MINNLPGVSASLYRYTAINETRVCEERKEKYNRDWTTLSIDRWITKLTLSVINRIPSILGHDSSSSLSIHFFSLLFFPPSLPPRRIASSLWNLDNSVTTRESTIDPSYVRWDIDIDCDRMIGATIYGYG